MTSKGAVYGGCNFCPFFLSTHCVVFYPLATCWLCRHGELLLALFQTTHLVEGKVNANHCLHNEFA